MNILTVSQITAYLRRLFVSDELLSWVGVKGEISSLSKSFAGHCYFVLKDQFSQISCVLFRRNLQKLKFEPASGMQVVAFGSIDIYERQGQYQLIVQEMEPEGIGDLFVAFLKLKEKLAREGLFDQKHKKPLPFLPGTVGIVTSPHGAAIQDIVRIATERNDAVRILISGCIVQGEEAPLSIIKALQRLQNRDVDVIILGRGGGSFEELMPFNDERLAQAIFASRIPVISAVGHETDFTIADMVADCRAPTPTAAAQMAIPEKAKMLADLEGFRKRLGTGLQKNVHILRLRLEAMSKRAVFRHPERCFERPRQDLDRLFARMEEAMARYLAGRKEKIQHLAENLEALNPLRVLARGYSLTLALPHMRIVRSWRQVMEKDPVRVLLGDGSLGCMVEELSPPGASLRDRNDTSRVS